MAELTCLEDKQIDRQTDRQINRQKDRQTDRQTDRQKEGETEKVITASNDHLLRNAREKEPKRDTPILLL